MFVVFLRPSVPEIQLLGANAYVCIEKAMGHVYAIFTILVWGSCFVLTKEMLKAYTAIQIIPCAWRLPM